MVSIGPNSQSNIFSHMYDIMDIRPSVKEKEKYFSKSIMENISTNIDFKKFLYIVKLAKLENLLNSQDRDFTLFVPSDKYISDISEDFFINMDYYTARQIVRSSMIENRIPAELLEDNPACYFKTKDPFNTLFVSNVSGKTYLNKKIQIIGKDIILSNGIIHLIDGLVIPIII